MDRKLEFASRLLKNLDCFRVGQADKRAIDDVLKRVDNHIVDPLVEEGHVLRTVRKNVGEDRLKEVFRDVHELPKIAEGDLGLDHPELCQVSRRIGTVSYTHLRAHETRHDLVCRLLLE